MTYLAHTIAMCTSSHLKPLMTQTSVVVQEAQWRSYEGSTLVIYPVNPLISILHYLTKLPMWVGEYWGWVVLLPNVNSLSIFWPIIYGYHFWKPFHQGRALGPRFVVLWALLQPKNNLFVKTSNTPFVPTPMNNFGSLTKN